MKLNQVIATERDVKKSAYNDLSKTHHLIQKPDSVSGSIGNYSPREEGGEQLPPEIRNVQNRVLDVLEDVKEKTVPYFDLVLTKDIGNTKATATLEIPDGRELHGVPVTTLLFLEKQLSDFHAFFSKLPTLPADHSWSWDDTQQIYVTAPVRSVKTAKVQRPIVLYPATPEHPAQTQLITEDVIAGEWTRIKQSGAMREKDRKALVKRTELLLIAVKEAREAANNIEVNKHAMGEVVMNYLLCGKAVTDDELNRKDDRKDETDDVPF
jgi:hypothetical protein